MRGRRCRVIPERLVQTLIRRKVGRGRAELEGAFGMSAVLNGHSAAVREVALKRSEAQSGSL